MNSMIDAPGAITLFTDRRALVSEVKKSLLDLNVATLPFVQTAVVCGPRGCGKSTLIGQSMCECSAVVRIFYAGKSNEDFANAVLRSLKITLPDNTNPMTFLLDVLTKLKEKPAFVVNLY